MIIDVRDKSSAIPDYRKAMVFNNVTPSVLSNYLKQLNETKKKGGDK